MTDKRENGKRNLLFLIWMGFATLSNTQVTDAGLAHLMGLTNLRGLPLENTNVSAAGVAKLHVAFPNCEIKWDNP